MKNPCVANKKRPVLLGNYYVLSGTIRESSKGDIYFATSLKNASFKNCIIKAGNPGVLMDRYQREMKDRLLWQKKVLRELDREVMTPAYMDYFENGEQSYLVLQYAKGEILYTVVKQHFAERSWNTMELAGKQKLLIIYLQALAIVKTIHQKGYVHRDISDSNFMLLNDGQLCILDFELSYSVLRNEPEHPFLLGSFGYMAPEQLQSAKPEFAEDIYSMAALLCFILSNTPPRDFIGKDHKKLGKTLQQLTSNTDLTQLILKCLSPNQRQRPNLSAIEDQVIIYSNHLNLQP